MCFDSNLVQMVAVRLFYLAQGVAWDHRHSFLGALLEAGTLESLSQLAAIQRSTGAHERLSQQIQFCLESTKVGTGRVKPVPLSNLRSLRATPRVQPVLMC